MKFLCLFCALAFLPACGTIQVQPSTLERSSVPARFDYERDDDLDDDLSRSAVPGGIDRLA
jgi:hypothetical protein